MVTAAKKNLRVAGKKGRVRRVVADAGYWSVDKVGLKGVESFIAPGRARQLTRIASAEHARAAILDRVEAGEIDTQEAVEKLGVTKGRVTQLLRRRRTGRPRPADHHDDRQGRQSTRPQDLQEGAPSIEPVFAQIIHNRRIQTISRRGLTDFRR